MSKNEIERIKSAYKSYREDKKYPKWTDDNCGNKWILEDRLDEMNKLLKSSDVNLENNKILEVGCAAEI